MRAIVAPGSNTDIAPAWLVSESTLFSKSEWQRRERVWAENKRRKGDGKGKGKKKGKGNGDGAGADPTKEKTH